MPGSDPVESAKVPNDPTGTPLLQKGRGATLKDGLELNGPIKILVRPP